MVMIAELKQIATNMSMPFYVSYSMLHFMFHILAQCTMTIFVVHGAPTAN